MGEEPCHPQEGGGDLSQNPTPSAAEPGTKLRSPSASSVWHLPLHFCLILVLVARMYLRQSSPVSQQG